jgi:hypothetical protein
MDIVSMPIKVCYAHSQTRTRQQQQHLITFLFVAGVVYPTMSEAIAALNTVYPTHDVKLDFAGDQ